MEDSLAEDRHSPVPGLVHRYPDRVLMLVTTQCASYCRYCTRSRIVGDPTQNFNSRDHEAQLEYLRRTPQVRDVLISGGDGLTLAPKLFEIDPPRAARDPSHRDHPHRLAGPGLPAAAHRRRAVRDAREVPPALDQPPLQPPERDHPEVSRAVDKLTKRRAAGRQPERPAGRRQRLRPHPALAGPQARRQPDPARTTSTSATWSRAPATSGRRSARASRSWRACAATPRATPCRPTSSTRPAAAARSRSCPTT